MLNNGHGTPNKLYIAQVVTVKYKFNAGKSPNQSPALMHALRVI